MSKKILVVLTNTAKYPTLKRATGLWLGEAVHFVEVVEKVATPLTMSAPTADTFPLIRTACRWRLIWIGSGMTTSSS